MTTNIKQLTQDALNCYTSGAAVIISGTTDFPAWLKTFLEAPVHTFVCRSQALTVRI